MWRTFQARNLERLSTATRPALKGLRFLSLRADKLDGSLEEEQRAARAWLASFNMSTIPNNLYEVSFSKSSGPGGQHVNKYISLKNKSLIYTDV